MTNTRLADLVRAVFEVQRHELVFGERLPSWVASERWDIVGKGPPISDEVAQRPLLFAMMRNLLIERFKLVTRPTRIAPRTATSAGERVSDRLGGAPNGRLKPAAAVSVRGTAQ